MDINGFNLTERMNAYARKERAEVILPGSFDISEKVT